MILKKNKDSFTFNPKFMSDLVLLTIKNIYNLSKFNII